MQVNVSGEAGKGGVPPGEALALLHAVAALPRLRVRGLMCMLPYGADRRAATRGFRAPPRSCLKRPGRRDWRWTHSRWG